MRVAVLSDIHSNAHALDAVLEVVGPFDQLWVLGDIVGYGPHPDQVVDRLRSERAVAVQGNHDAAALGRIPTGTFNDLARAAVEWTAATILPATRRWLAGLPERRVEGDFTLAHGSPRDPLWEYLLAVPAARRSLGVLETPYCLVGHTHLPLVFREEGGDVEALHAGDGAHLRLDERRCIVNPGSVGQPRDGDPRAAWLELDIAAETACFHRVPYEIAMAADPIAAAGLPQRLADRLHIGQ
jgi:diadenosine tetraphosphatase ApaH/serine/threonine PP2A family protein phosphatase